MKKETYSYSEDFQLKIVSLALKDPSFLLEYDDVIDPSYLDYEYLTSVLRIGKDLFKKHQEPVGKDTLVESIKDYCISYKIPSEDVENILLGVDKIYNLDVIDSSAVKERVINFGKRQALKSGVLQVCDIINKDSGYDEAVSIIESATRVGHGLNNLGLDFFKEIKNPSKLMRKDERGFIHKIPTLLPILDQKTLGGPGRGEVWVVLGMSGMGKSQFLINIGASAIDQGFPVVYITIGDLDEVDVGLRFAGRITLTPQDKILSSDPAFLRKADKLAQLKDRYLKIKYYDPGEIRPSNIKAYLSKLITVDNIKPALVIIDYPDEFNPYCDDLYTNGGRIYTELKAIAGQFKVLIWAASQVNRWTPKYKGDVITRSNIADSAKKVHKADGIVSINQTFEESNAGKARLWVDKTRRGKQFFLVPLDVDYSMSLIRQGTLLDDNE